MKLKWGTRKFTFMIIPAANRSVLRFKIPALVLYVIPFIFLLMLCATLTVYIIHLKSTVVTYQLKAELAHNADKYKKTVVTKDKTISDLQNDVILLSQQAEEVQNKIDELKKLETDIRGVQDGGVTPKSGKTGLGGASADSANSTDSASKSKPISIANSSSDSVFDFQAANGDPAKSGTGGLLIPVSDEEIARLIADTKKSLSDSFGKTDGLFANLTDAKKMVLDEQYLSRVTPSLWPTISLRVTSIFGYRKDPFTHRPSFHAGIDIAGNVGDPVYVTADGTVQYAGRDSSHGNNIIAKHANGLSTRYMHLTKILVTEGDKVGKGSKIGLLGSTGRSTGPHLHYEVIKNGENIDPRPYMQSRGSGKLNVQEEKVQD